MDRVSQLQRLRLSHADAVLAFELANRAYFAILISDRGGDFYIQFMQRPVVLLAEQEAGINAFYVLVEGGSVRGRFNFYDTRGRNRHARLSSGGGSRRPRGGNCDRKRDVPVGGGAVRAAH